MVGRGESDDFPLEGCHRTNGFKEFYKENSGRWRRNTAITPQPGLVWQRRDSRLRLRVTIRTVIAHHERCADALPGGLKGNKEPSPALHETRSLRDEEMLTATPTCGSL